MLQNRVSQPAARSIARIALEIAEAYAAARIHEEGGNNRGDQVEFYQSLMGGAPGDPWCADFVCTCLVKAYARSRGLPEDRQRLRELVAAASEALLPLSGYCPDLAHGASARGLLRAAGHQPAPGDLVLFDFHGAGEPHHVGFVCAAPGPNGLLATVEGNTSSGLAGSQADGDGVFCRQRQVGHVFGYAGW